MFIKWVFDYWIRMDEEMGTEYKFTYTRPKQIPLFEEEDDGSLMQYIQERQVK